MSVVAIAFRWALFLIFFVLAVETEGSPAIDAERRAVIVARVASIMTANFVDPTMGREMARYIQSRHGRGAYDNHADIESFCSALTADLRSVTNDKHLYVFHSPEEAREVAVRMKLLAEDENRDIEQRRREAYRRENFGFQKIEILAGNVGYLKLQYFAGTENGAEAAVAAMAFLSNADAIIVDLTENGGGEGLVPLLISYFLPPEEVELTGVYYRASDTVRRSWSYSYVPGRRLPNVDLYILTSSRTFSAAEDFAYTMQQLARAVVVGERSKGGAHPVDVLIVDENVLTQVSIGKSINPVTKTNWEGVGVEPDFPVPAEEALATAYLLALKGLLGKTTDKERSEELGALIEKTGRVEH